MSNISIVTIIQTLHLCCTTILMAIHINVADPTQAFSKFEGCTCYYPAREIG